MLYALTQPERELLGNRYGTRTKQYLHDQTTSVHPIKLTCAAIVSPNMTDFASQGLWPFPDDIFISLFKNYSRFNLGKTGVGFIS